MECGHRDTTRILGTRTFSPSPRVDRIFCVENESQSIQPPNCLVPIVTEIVPLSLLSRGVSARIADVGGDPRMVHRLRELGLHEGVNLQMVQPGRPCIIALGSQRLSLRSELEDQILVEVVHG